MVALLIFLFPLSKVKGGVKERIIFKTRNALLRGGEPQSLPRKPTVLGLYHGQGPIMSGVRLCAASKVTS